MTIPVGYVSVKSIVNQTLVDTTDMNTSSEFLRRLSWALLELRTLGLLWEVFPEETYIIRDSNTNLVNPTTMTAPLPQNYVTWKDVGYMIGDQFVRLTYNYQLKPVWATDECGNDIANITSYNPEYTSGYVFGPGYGYTGAPYHNFGIGGGSTLGGFSIDMKNSRIQFDFQPMPDFMLIMHYTTNGMGGTEHYIDAYCEKLIRDCIHANVERFRRNATLGEKQMAMAIYEASKRDTKLEMYKPSMFQVMDWLRQNTYSAPKM